MEYLLALALAPILFAGGFAVVMAWLGKFETPARGKGRPKSSLGDYPNISVRAAMRGALDTVKRFVGTYRFDLRSDNGSAFRMAADKGHLEIVKFLLPYSDPPALDHAFRMAAWTGHLEIVKFLLPHSDPEAHYSEAFCWAAENGHLEIVKLLLPYSDPKAQDSQAFRFAAENGHLEVVKFLLPHSDPEVVREFI